MPGKPRPTDFSVPPGSDHKLVELERFIVDEVAATENFHRDSNLKFTRNSKHKWIESVTLGKLANPKETLANVHDLRKLHKLTITDIDVETARQFANHEAIRTLEFHQDVDPKVLEVFASLPNLQQIEFRANRFPETWGEALQASRSLSWIQFYDIKRDVSGLKHLRESNIEMLIFRKSKLDRSSFEAIANLKSLKTFVVDDCKASKGDISPLSRCKQIQNLQLANFDITDDDIHSLGSLPMLGILDIRGTSVSNSSMEHILANFPALYSLHATNVGFDSGIISMLEKQPNNLRYVSLSSSSISKHVAKTASSRVAEMLKIR